LGGWAESFHLLIVRPCLIDNLSSVSTGKAVNLRLPLVEDRCDLKLPIVGKQAFSSCTIKESEVKGMALTYQKMETILRRSLLAGSLILTGCLSQKVEAQPVFTFTPPPIPGGTATTRGCRTGGPFGIKKIDPSWVSVEPSDAPRIAEGVVRESHTATNDNPAFHTSHDWNADLFLDPSFNGLNSNGNKIEGGERLMEIEWETAFFPPRFWPAPGDRAWILGRWIFDCGHPEPAYRSEIHPPKAVAFTRLEPIIFPGDVMPSQSNLTYMYLNGRGGYYKKPVVGTNYELDVPLPPKPSRFSRLRTAVLSLPFGGPSPTLTPLPTANPTRLHVNYPLLSVSDPDNTGQFGAVIATAWDNGISSVFNQPNYRLLRVTFDSIKINEDHDSILSGTGEWRLWVRAGGEWFEVTGLGDVDDGDTVQIGKSIELIVPDDGKLEIQTSGWEDDCDSRFRGNDSGIKLWDASIADLRCEINGNDDIGMIERRYTPANNFGIGGHNDTSARNGDADTEGDFNLSYRVELVKRFSSDPVVGGTPIAPVISPTP
jgi:hypothetical protein